MILVTGGTGQLGTALKALIPHAEYPERTALDLRRPDSVRVHLGQSQPAAIVNCAAYTNVDGAEAEEDLATVVNGESVGIMAEYAAGRDIPFVTFSTDYVFDGTASRPYVESDPVNPINAYGRSKLVGEQAALAAHPGCLVIRTSWVISGTHPNFVTTMLRLAKERDRLGVVDDQWGRPTIASDLAAGVVHAMNAGVSGLLHLTNTGETTWCRLAATALGLAGLDPDTIEPITTADYPTPALRPAYSVLGSERLEPLGLTPLPPWEESLPGVVSAMESDA